MQQFFCKMLCKTFCKKIVKIPVKVENITLLIILLSLLDIIVENVLFYKKTGTIFNVFAIIDFIHATSVINYISVIAWIYPRNFPRFSDGGSKDFQT